MSFDFPLLLVLATFITGAIWALDHWWLAPRRRQRNPEASEPYIVDLSRSMFPIILAVLVIRSFIVEPFRIPSGSMMPTLLVGDFILVNKFAYGIRLPVVNYRFLDLGSPQRGDVAVFRYPEEPSIDYIKRVVGVPGDEIAYYNRVLHINGQPVSLTPIDRYVGVGGGAVMTGALRLYEGEAGSGHEILIMDSRPSFNFEFTVPEGEYFVLGDNRDNSRDSRFWGTVTDDHLVGKAFMIWMNWDSNAPGIVDWRRIGNVIR
jgi:signal peptidase I